MTKKIDIGASISSRTDASATVEYVFAAEEFPCTLTVENHAVTRLVLPELKGLDISELGSVDAHFADIGMLKRVVSSLAQIARLNRFPKLATIHVPSYLEVPNEPENPAPEDQDNIEKTDVLGLGENTATQDPDEVKATLIEEQPGGILLVAVGDIQFEVKKGQLRENGTLTAGGMTAYEAAKNTTNE